MPASNSVPSSPRPALDRPALDRVLALDFLDRAENVILVGAQGLGKTMLEERGRLGWPQALSCVLL